MSAHADDLRLLRSQVCHAASDWLAAAGNSLWVSAWATKDRSTEAVALVTQMIGELGQEAADAFDRGRWYAATALTRQVVEAHYLLAVFRDDADQRARWLGASTNRIEKSFRPGQMRAAGGFSVSEYKHCAWGGHLNRSARWLLPNNTGTVDPSLLSADLGMHLTETVDLLVSILATIPNADAMVEHLPGQEDLPEKYRHWRAEDPLSRRVQIPEHPAGPQSNSSP